MDLVVRHLEPKSKALEEQFCWKLDLENPVRLTNTLFFNDSKFPLGDFERPARVWLNICFCWWVHLRPFIRIDPHPKL